MSQFVALPLFEADPAEKSKWRRQYPSEGAGIPIIYVVRGDGEKLYGKSGSPESLAKFLQAFLQQSGTLLNEAELTKLYDAVETAKAAMADDDVGTALRVLSAAPGQGSFSKAAVEASEIVKAVIERADGEIAKAEELVADSVSHFEGALLIARAAQNYAKLPEQRRKVGLVMRKYKKDDAAALALDQAESFVRAEVKEKSDNTEGAGKAYQTLVEKYPGSEVAKLSAERIEAITGEATDAGTPSVGESAGDEFRTWTSSGGKFTIKARLVKADATTVRLELESGKTISVPLAKLSKADNEFVQQQLEK